jgi:ketosteroid isomerase-like protein
MEEENAILAANAAYYRAFVTCDIAAMSDLWAPDEVSCIHPGWPVLIGRRAILESYFGILTNPGQDPIEHHNEMVLMSGKEARVFCIEIASGVRLAATNWFRCIDGNWRMIHHQASPIGPLGEERRQQTAARRLN